MQIIRKAKPLIIILGLYLIWKFTPINQIPVTFYKRDHFVARYEVIFFPLALLFSFVINSKAKEWGLFKGISVSLIFGHLTSMISIVGVSFIETGKISDSFLWGLFTYGILDGLSFFFLFPVPALGWLFFLADFLLLRLGAKKVTALTP